MYSAYKYDIYTNLPQQIIAAADEACKTTIMDDIFAACRLKIHYSTFLAKCKADTCAAQDPLSSLASCTWVAAMARECAQKGILVDWLSVHDNSFNCGE